MVQWLGLCSITAEGVSLIPGWGTKILQAARCRLPTQIYIHTHTHTHTHTYTYVKSQVHHSCSVNAKHLS